MISVPFVSTCDEEEQRAWLAALRRVLPDLHIGPIDALDEAARAGAEVAIVANPDPRELRRLPGLVWVQSLWAGVERLVSETADLPFSIVRMVDPELTRAMAEAALAWTLYLHRDMPRYRQQQMQRVWKPHHLPLPGERTIGILGLGELGKACADVLLKHGFRVAGWSRSGRAVSGVDMFAGDGGLYELLSVSNIVLVLLPLTPHTTGLLDAEALARLPRGAAVINFARGAIIVDDDLLSALDSGRLDHAVLDVFEREPLPGSSRYWTHPGVTVLPHISAPTNMTTASEIVRQNIEAYLRDGTIPETVDRQLGY